MTIRTAWIFSSCLMVAALVLSPCKAAQAEEKKKAEGLSDEEARMAAFYQNAADRLRAGGN